MVVVAHNPRHVRQIAPKKPPSCGVTLIAPKPMQIIVAAQILYYDRSRITCSSAPIAL